MKRFILLLLASLGCICFTFAREVIPMNEGWRFYFSTENSGDYARTINLPHTWDLPQSNVAFAMDNITANYSRNIKVASEWRGKRIFIKFYGVQSCADVLLNGQYVGEHRGGATAFTMELTDKIKFNGNNSLQVVVTNSPQSDILPTSIEYESFGGIYRSVELIVAEPLTISPLHFGSDGVYVKPTKISSTQAEGAVQIMVDSKIDASFQATLSIFDSNGDIAFIKRVDKLRANATSVEIPFSIQNPKLWSLDDPHLYTFKATINSDEIRDEVVVESGLRKIEVGESGLLRLNDKPLKLNGVSLYHDYPLVGSAASPRDIDTDFALIDEMGANAIRSAIAPHNQYLYDLCDRQGKLVWIELPFARAPFFSDIAYYPTERFHQNGCNQLQEIIYQNYNHPAVVMWGLFSLLWQRGDDFTPYLVELNKLAHQIDPSRPTVALSNQNGDMNNVTDLVVWQQDFGWEKGQFSDIKLWSDLLHERFPQLRSGVAYGESGRIDHQSNGGSSMSRNDNRDNPLWFPEGRAREMHNEYSKSLDPDSLLWGTWLTTMFDYSSPRSSLGENNSGVVTLDRRNRKDIFYLYKALWNRSEPTLYIAGRRQTDVNNKLHRVEVYSSDTIAPVLYTPLDTITMKSVAPARFAADSVLLNKGSNRIVVKSGELSDAVDLRFDTTQGSISRRGNF